MPEAAPYDPTNIFARILRKEIPSRLVYEDDVAVAFHDITPQAPVHLLVICRTPYVSLSDFSSRAPQPEVAAFFQAVGKVATAFGLDQPGYRVVTNHGPDSGQEVPHFHVHILGGAPLGPMLPARMD